jgi:hypothetical protein
MSIAELTANPPAPRPQIIAGEVERERTAGPPG